MQLKKEDKELTLPIGTKLIDGFVEFSQKTVLETLLKYAVVTALVAICLHFGWHHLAKLLKSAKE